jgi:hypothetical protein
MFLYFVGGSLGSYLGAIAWAHWGWLGVCGLASVVLTLALGMYAAFGIRSARVSGD